MATESDSELQETQVSEDSAKPKKMRGKYKRKSDGELYELTISPPNAITGRTHKAVNEIHTWEGVSMDFARDFTKEDGSTLLPSI